jgi:hypothetical protein
VYRDLALAYLDRLRQTRDRIVREVQVPEPILDVTADEAGLTLKTEGGATYFVDTARATNRGPPLSLAPGEQRTRATTPAPIVQTRPAWAASLAVEAITQTIASQTEREYGYRPGQCPASVAFSEVAERMYVTSDCDIDATAFVATVDAPFATPTSVSQFPLRGYFDIGPPPPDLAVITIEINGEPSTFVIADTSAGKRSRTFEVTVSRLERSGEVQFLARHSQIIDEIPTSNEVMDWIRVIHPALLTCRGLASKHILCTQYLDGEYVFDVARSRLSVLFYPPGGPRVSVDGVHWAYWARGGYKLYVVSIADAATM